MKYSRWVVFSSCALVVLIGFIAFHPALAHKGHTAVANPNIIPDLDADTRTNPYALQDYKAAIRQLFLQDNFSEIERLAKSARENKERFSGGYWKLGQIYLALALPGDPSDDSAWTEQIERLERWQKQMPNSITPRLALAETYVYYANQARGDGFSDSVSKAGWKLYGERTAKAHAILNDVESLSANDPRWAYIMMTVALNEGWERDREDELFQKAIAKEPSYWPYYREYVIYLRPQWFGEPGEIARFADDTYVRLGPVQGPIAYFEIAAIASCRCGDERTVTFKMSRVKEGYNLSAKTYGPSLGQLNALGFVAWVSHDADSLEETFNQIGENYVADDWQDPNNFQLAHQWLDWAKANGTTQ